jgi:hypothetical protein
MLNWFEAYDRETYMTHFLSVTYSKFNPFSADETYFNATMRSSHNYELTMLQFKAYLENHNIETDMKKRLHDPLA